MMKRQFHFIVAPRLSLLLSLAMFMSLSVEAQDLSFRELDRLGREDFVRGNYDQAEKYFRLALDRTAAEDVPDTDMVTALGNLAEQLRLTGRYQESEEFYARAIAILRTGTVEDPRLAPLVWATQGKMYEQAGKFALSESSFKEAFRLAQRDLGDEHAVMAKILNLRGTLYI